MISFYMNQKVKLIYIN